MGSKFLEYEEPTCTAPTSDDLVLIMDNPSVPQPQNKKVTIGNLFKNIPDGLVTAPSLAFSSDPDTGFYWIASKQAGYAIDGVKKFGFYERTALDGLGVSEEVGGGALLVYGSTTAEYTMLSHYIYGATLTTKNAHSQLEIDVWNGSAFESVACFRCPGVDARGLQIRNAADTDGINIYCCHPTYGGNYINMSETNDAMISTDGEDIICLKNAHSADHAQEFRVYAGSGAYGTIKSKQELCTTAAAATELTAADFIPAGAIPLAISTYVETAITTAGLTGYTVGDGIDADRWGAIVGHAIGTHSDNTDWVATTIQAFVAAQAITLTASGANFPAGGKIRVCMTYISGGPPTS